MPDLPIVIPDTAAAPKDYTLSGTQELALKTVRALIDGSAAGSAFLPTLQLLDPNGHVMWEGATFGTVAAGGSADVSWFPGVTSTGDGIKFDQPNIDPLGIAGELAIDTGSVIFGNTIPADWQVTAIDYQFASSGPSGYDFECSGGTFTINAFDFGGHSGTVTIEGESGMSISAGGGTGLSLSVGTTSIVLHTGGVVIFPTNLPIADPDVSGHLWNSGGTLKISP